MNIITKIVLLVLLFCCSSSYSQTEQQKEDLKQTTSKVDSLLQIWESPNSSDAERLNALGRLFNQYLYNDRDSSQKYLTLMEEFSIEKSLERGIVRSNQFKGILFDLSGQLDSSRAYYTLAYNGYARLKDTLQLSRTILNLAIIDYQQGNYQTAIDSLQGGIGICRKAFGDNHAELGGLYGLIGNIYSEQAYNQLALQNTLTALNYHEQSGDDIRKADALNMLGNIEYNIGNYEKVIDYNLEAINIYQDYKDYYYQAQAYADIGNAYIQLQRFQEAEPALAKGLELAKQMNANDISGKIYTYQSKIFTASKEYNKAFQLLNQSLLIHQEIGNPAQVAVTLEHIGNNYLKIEQTTKALSYFNQVINMADTVEIVDQQHSSLLYRAQVYEKLNRPSEALQDLKAYQVLHDTLLNKTTIEQIEELRIIHDTEKKEREIILQENQITLLENEANVNRLQRWLLGGGLGLSITIFGLGYYGIRQKLKRNKLQHQHTLQEKELEIERRKNAETQLEFKRKELMAKVLQLASKNEFLQKLEDEVLELKSSVDQSVTKTSSRISRMIHRDTNDDDEWNQFSKEFTSVHQGFINKIIKTYGSFSQSELRLASLLKMNLTSKDIANILRISDEGIKKARYRLRKKMGLKNGDDLQGTILSL